VLELQMLLLFETATGSVSGACVVLTRRAIKDGRLVEKKQKKKTSK
jgi:hypothetical protein